MSGVAPPYGRGARVFGDLGGRRGGSETNLAFREPSPQGLVRRTGAVEETNRDACGGHRLRHPPPHRAISSVDNAPRDRSDLVEVDVEYGDLQGVARSLGVVCRNDPEKSAPLFNSTELVLRPRGANVSRSFSNSLRKYDCRASRPTGIFIAKANDRSPSSSSTVNDAIWRSPRCTAAASEFLGRASP